VSEVFLRLPELKKHGVPWSRAHVYREVKFGRFPRPVKLGPATTAWLLSEILAWQRARIAARDAA
jgi:prophage regulatory protein